MSEVANWSSAPSRHAELVSASSSNAAVRTGRWTLKQVQGDGQLMARRKAGEDAAEFEGDAVRVEREADGAAGEIAGALPGGERGDVQLGHFLEIGKIHPVDGVAICDAVPDAHILVLVIVILDRDRGGGGVPAGAGSGDGARARRRRSGRPSELSGIVTLNLFQGPALDSRGGSTLDAETSSA